MSLVNRQIYAETKPFLQRLRIGYQFCCLNCAQNLFYDEIDKPYERLLKPLHSVIYNEFCETSFSNVTPSGQDFSERIEEVLQLTRPFEVEKVDTTTHGSVPGSSLFATCRITIYTRT